MKKNLLRAVACSLLIISANVVLAQSFAENIVSQWTFNDGTATDIKTGVVGSIIG